MAKRLVKLRFRESRRGSGGMFFLDFNIGGTRKRVSLGHGNAERAERQRRLKEIEIATFDARHCEGARQRLSELAENFCMAHKSQSACTRDKVLRAFDFLIIEVGDMEIGKFEYSHAEAFQRLFVDNGYTASSTNGYTKSISPAFTWAIKHHWLHVNPFASLTHVRQGKQFIRIYEPDEFVALYRSCENDIWRARLLAAKTAGLRRSEVLNLCRSDVDYRRGVIRIQPKAETPTTWRWQIKDHDCREVPLVGELAVLLDKLGKTLPPDQPYLMLSEQVYNNKLTARLAGRLSDMGRILPDWNFNADFAEMRERAEIDGVTYHDLRRTAVTEWLESGLQPHEVMELAGHSSIETTMRYYTATRKTLLEKAKKASNSRLVGVA